MDLHKERKSIKEGISEGEIKSFILFLFLIDRTDNSLLKTTVYSVSYTYSYKYAYACLYISEISDNNTMNKMEKLRIFYSTKGLHPL